jgi:hypothetical protein
MPVFCVSEARSCRDAWNIPSFGPNQAVNGRQSGFRTFASAQGLCEVTKMYLAPEIQNYSYSFTRNERARDVLLIQAWNEIDRRNRAWEFSEVVSRKYVKGPWIVYRAESSSSNGIAVVRRRPNSAVSRTWPTPILYNKYYAPYTRTVRKVHALAAVRRCYASLCIKVAHSHQSTNFSNGPRSCSAILKRVLLK